MAELAVVGAGAAGLAAGYALARAGQNVTIFEQHHEVGGRLATRHVAHCAIDHGAQIVKAPTGPLQALIEATGTAHDLLGPVWIFDGAGQISPGDPVFNAEPKWVWPAGNVALAHHLAHGLNLHLETTITALQRTGSGYELLDEAGANVGRFAAVLLTVPAPQAATILSASDLDPQTRTELLAALAPVHYRRCLSLALAYARRPALPWYALLNLDRNHPIAWLACEHAKPGRAPDGTALLLAQMGPAWSETHWAALATGTYGLGTSLPAAVSEAHTLTQHLVGEALGAPLWADVHHWRYALCDAPYGSAAREGRDGVFLAGDMEHGLGRVHLAVESGWAAAERILAHVNHAH